MDRSVSRIVRLCATVAVVAGLSPLPVKAAVGAEGAVAESVARMQASAGPDLFVQHSKTTDLVRFLSARKGQGIHVGGAGTPAELRARAFLDGYGAAFGIREAAEYEIKATSPRDEVGMEHVRVRQVHKGVPVTGGEMFVHLKGEYVVAANGKTVSDLDSVDVVPGVASEAAVQTALQTLADKYGQRDLEPLEPRLEVFNRGLLEGRPFASRLAWFVEARRMDAREFVWVDAHDGAVLLRFSQLTDALNRSIYNGNNAAALPGTLIRSEGGPPTGIGDSNQAYDFSGDTYNYFFNQHGRDSYDGLGAPIKSTINHCPTPGECPFANAFWNGVQMVYGQGFAAADDVDGHELAHAVTEYSAGLFYYMQSGGLNESFSDIFGESIDLMNGAGNDTAGVRWKMGEDVPVFGALRNMMNPGEFGDPNRIGDFNYPCDQAEDGGGVHSSSGVPNHAFALMVDGGTFNGRTVVGIGLTKAGKIQYRALTQYLSSASDFLDDYNSLNRSCADLVGTAGITVADCAQVKTALDAVEMANTVICLPPQGSVPPLCPAGQAPTLFDFEDVESPGLADCSGLPTAWCRNGPNSIVGTYATSGTHSYWGYAPATAGTRWLTLTLGGALPANARLQFNHSFGFEGYSFENSDGGILEYSTNGTNFFSALPLISSGASYNGTIAVGLNPLGGQQGFTHASWGYTATQLNLASLAGQQFALKFTVGTDGSIDDYGWFVDDIRAYTCVNQAPPRADFDQDRSTDLTIYHEASGLWYHRNSATGNTVSVTFGGPGYAPVPGDFDGDDKSDEAIFHAGSGIWYVRPSSTGATYSVAFGGPGYNVVAADYDGDGRTDLALYHPPTGLWYIRQSFTGATLTLGYGGTGYAPVPGDYDGDGRADLAVFHASSGLWFIRASSTGATSVIGFGGVGYTPVPRDYDGDGRTDLAVYHPPSGLWYIRQSLTGTTINTGFGSSAYAPVPADYDGDGKADIAVFHAPSGLWFIRKSHNNAVEILAFGGAGFAPVN
jgi:bacillolysin